MKELTIISGKGGTGKTTIAASFGVLAGNAVLVDCDVDAADLYIVTSPSVREKYDFKGGKGADVIADKCTSCGTCKDLCRFDAISFTGTGTAVIDQVSCEGCGVCAWFCPSHAIDFSEKINGEWFISDTRMGPMVHAKLGAGEENSGKLITLLRTTAKSIAQKKGHDLIVCDGSPGTGCPVIASITTAHLVLVVCEPTVSGIHDFKRVAALAKQLGVPVSVCVNKYDIHEQNTDKIRIFAQENNIHWAGTVRYDKRINQAQKEKKAVVECFNDGCVNDIRAVWTAISEKLD